VYGVNGNGTSVGKALTCTSAAPKTPGSITTPTLAKPTYNTTCNNEFTVQVPSVLGVSYAWSVSGGAEVVSGQGSSSIVINTANASATLTISVIASTDTGSSLPKILTIKKATSCAKIASEKAVSENELSVIAYPNPSSDVFNIEASGIGATTIEVYDMQGRLIENRKANSNKVQVGARLSAGTYNVVVKQDTNVKTVRVIKK
jgi:hypothetical protein